MKSTLQITRLPLHSPEWYEFRKNGIGGSEISTILGLNPYNTAARTYHEKIGSLPINIIDNPKMFFGRFMEDKIAELWEYYDGSELGWIENYKNKKIIRKCRNINGYVVNPDYPWLFASLDRVQNIEGGRNLITGQALKTEAVLEVKTLSYWASSMWQDSIPISYLLQVHQYMIILETDYAELAILKDGNELYVEKVQRDDGLCEKIIEISKNFWYNCIVPAKEAFVKMTQAEMKGDMKESEQYESIIQQLEPEPDKTESYTAFMSERFLKEKATMPGNMFTYDLCKQDKVLLGIKNLIDEERTGIKNKIIKELTVNGAESIDFGKLGSCDWSERKGSKNRTFSNRIRESPSEEQLLLEFKKINLECY